MHCCALGRFLIGVATQLSKTGIVQYFAEGLASTIAPLALPWPVVVIGGCLAYFVLHYLTASQLAHLTAFYTAFLSLMITAGAPPILSALALAHTTDLMGSITHYASGQVRLVRGSN